MSSDTIWLTLGALSIGFIIYYAIHSAPPSDMLYQAQSHDLISQLESYLVANGIKVYTKNTTFNRLGRASINPSIHVVYIQDKDMALILLNKKLNKTNHE
jgi:hypothetical protein